MRTHQEKAGLPSKELATGTQSVIFHDGMVVTADDLETASHYSVSLLQTVLRSYLGCGVVCGFGLSAIAKLRGEPPWTVRVDRGLAVDCHGYPIELDCPIELDFNPDPCSPDDLPDKAYIALRRSTSKENASNPCGCSQDPASQDCRRVRNRVQVKAFTEDQLCDLRGGICQDSTVLCNGDSGNNLDGPDTQKPQNGGEDQQSDATTDPCAILKECNGCSAQSDWILLGTVKFKTNASEEKAGRGVEEATTEGRRWVKPVAAFCGVNDLAQQITDLKDAVRKLQNANPR
jgi:hypothetical protein